MKSRKLLPFLLVVALIACVPTATPIAQPPTRTPFPSRTPIVQPPTRTPFPSGTPVVEPPTRTALPAAVTVDTATATPTATGPQWGHQTKTSGCQVQGPFPDSACTPGDIFPNVTKDQVCTPGYSSGVRNVGASEKDQVYAEYGIFSHSAGQYEVDHFVPLELGGSNDISNLWPEPADPTPGFHQKDEVENYLHDQMCQHGIIMLSQAQLEISTNWLAVYATMIGGGSTQPPPTTAQSSTQASHPTVPSGTSGFTLTQLTSPVARGGNAAATIQTAAGAACSIGYVTPSGNQSAAQGLVSETAGGNGVCAWSWKIGTGTYPGTGTVTITANGATQSFPIVVQ